MSERKRYRGNSLYSLPFPLTERERERESERERERTVSSLLSELAISHNKTEAA